MPQATAAPRDASVLRSPRRLALAFLGLVCVALALAGVFVPGLPTTIFLILASYLLTRSCPWLEERVLTMRVFRPFVPYVKGGRPMPRRARVAALAMMWSAVAVSLSLMAASGRAPFWVAAIVVAAAGLGSVAILRWRREPRRA